MSARPTVRLPDWATSATGILNTSDPGAPKQADGWDASNERPPGPWWNWWWGSVGKWIRYLAGTTDFQFLNYSEMFHTTYSYTVTRPGLLALHNVQTGTGTEMVGIFKRDAADITASRAAIMVSLDGMKWADITDPLMLLTNFIDVASTGFSIVAMEGSGGTFWRTPTWPGTWANVFAFPGAGIYHSVTAGNGIYVVAGVSDIGVPDIHTSPDGVTWTTRTLPGVGALAVTTGRAANDGGNNWICPVTAGTNCYRSTDNGATWIAFTKPGTANDIFCSSAYDTTTGFWFMLGYNNSTNVAVVAYATSPAGVWTVLQIPRTLVQTGDPRMNRLRLVFDGEGHGVAIVGYPGDNRNYVIYFSGNFSGSVYETPIAHPIMTRDTDINPPAVCHLLGSSGFYLGGDGISNAYPRVLKSMATLVAY